MDNRDFKNSVGGGISNNHNIFEKIILLENLFLAWSEFKRGKERKLDVQKFDIDLEDNIFDLHRWLKTNIYEHSPYKSFYIHDPKLRHIHKAEVKDRLLHHAIVRVIEPLFEKIFIFDSYSSRKNKGVHKAIKRLNQFAWRLSQNDTKTVWILKCDIKKFFDSVDHDILLDIIPRKIKDKKSIFLIEKVVRSFQVQSGKGIPLGNLTSQLFSNIYLNELDQFIKRELREKYYIRYADDFVIMNLDKIHLENLVFNVSRFLNSKLNLELHPEKITIKKWYQGIDFLGYKIFPHYIILRTRTKQRILKKIKDKNYKRKTKLISEKSFNQSFQSYFGVLRHCRGYKIKIKISQIILMK